MRKRRVGVTARSRQNEGSQETGYPQLDSEMAAPLELRTPKGTCGESCKTSAYGSMVTKARELDEQESRRAEWGKEESRNAAGKERATGAHEALPHTPPGGKPPETLAPFPWVIEYTERRDFVKGTQAAQPQRALDEVPPFGRPHWDEGKGALGKTGGRRCRPEVSALRAHEALPHTPPGASPLGPP